MKKRIERRLELTSDEIKLAIFHWLKTIKDQPVPDDGHSNATCKLTRSGAVVAWTEEGEEQT